MWSRQNNSVQLYINAIKQIHYNVDYERATCVTTPVYIKRTPYSAKTELGLRLKA